MRFAERIEFAAGGADRLGSDRKNTACSPSSNRPGFFHSAARCAMSMVGVSRELPESADVFVNGTEEFVESFTAVFESFDRCPSFVRLLVRFDQLRPSQFELALDAVSVLVEPLGDRALRHKRRPLRNRDDRRSGSGVPGCAAEFGVVEVVEQFGDGVGEHPCLGFEDTGGLCGWRDADDGSMVAVEVGDDGLASIHRVGRGDWWSAGGGGAVAA
jgi:hypothetical protein